MKPPQDSPAANPAPDDEPDLEQALEQVERSLQALKNRHAQVQADQQRQQDLQPRLTQAQRELRHNRSQRLRTEVKQLQQQLEELEFALESQLFSWGSLKEPFWQAIRFGGLGVVVGWLLRSWMG